MAAGDIVPVPGESFEHTLMSGAPDVVREMFRAFAQRMMDAEVEAVCGAGYGEVSPDRINSLYSFACLGLCGASGRLMLPRFPGR